MPASYQPGPQAEFADWARSFSGQISATPVAFGLSAETASQYATTLQRFLDLMALGNDGSTRTPKVVAEKQAAERTLRNATNSVVRQVQAFPPLTDGQRRALGITVPSPRTPIGPPAEVPNLIVDAVAGRRGRGPTARRGGAGGASPRAARAPTSTRSSATPRRPS